MARIVGLAALVAALLSCAGCSGRTDKGLNASSSPDITDTRFKYVVSSAPRDTSPRASKADQEELSRGNADFAFALYKELKSSPGNVIFSPYSLTTAMALLYAGAGGNTEAEIAKAFHYTLPQERLHKAFNAVDLELKSRGGPADRSEHLVDRSSEPMFRLNVANAIWGPPEKAWEPSYLDLIARDYGAGLRTMDLAADPEGARKIINAWVSENTESRIPELIQQGELISDATVLVITNAVYFKARWEMPFEEKYTRPRDFHLLDGSTVSVPTMEFVEGSMSFQRAVGDGWTAISLPYDLDGVQGIPWEEYRKTLAMIVIVPDQGRFAEFESSLDSARFEFIVQSFNRGPAHFFMPKFTYRFHRPLKEALSNMGMPSVFGAADLSGMLQGGGLFVRDVIHEAFIQVDEKGTEAAAASAIGVDMAGGELLNLSIDRPFIYLIRDANTGAILFIGRVLNPLET